MTQTSTDDTDPPRAQADTRPARRPRLRKLHFHIGFWTLVSIALVAAFLVLASMSLTGRVLVLPDWVAGQVRDKINSEMNEGSVSLRRVEFGVTPRGRPRLRLIDVGIKDATGLGLAQLNAVEGGFDLGAALTGSFLPRRVSLQGAQVRLRRLADGSFAITLGQQTPDAIGNLASVLDEIDKVFTDGVLAGTDKVEVSELTITLEDARSGRLWQVTDGRLEATQTDTLVDITVSFDVFNQTEALAHTVFSARSDKATSEASFSARFDNAAAQDLAAQTPALAFLSVLDAPISGVLRSTIDAGGAISELVGTMEIGAGAVSPGTGTPPAKFDGGKVYIDFDPSQNRLDMLGLQARSELGTINGEGHFYLAEFVGGWPTSLVGQVKLASGEIDPPDYFAAPLTIDSGISDFRLKFDPFTFEIGQAVVYRDDRRFTVSGEIAAEPDGWRIALDAEADKADLPEVLALWPVGAPGRGRAWVAEHVEAGTVRDARMAFRRAPGGKFEMSGVYTIEDAKVRPLDDFPPLMLESGYVSQAPGTLTVVAEQGHIIAPDGSKMDLAGFTYHVPELRNPPTTGIVDLRLAGPLEGAMSLLDGPPFEVFKNTDLGPDLARGFIETRGLIRFPQGQGIKVDMDNVDFDITAKLTDVRSDQLIGDKLLIGDALDLVASNDAIEVSGAVRIGQAEAFGTWRQPLGDGAAPGGVTGTLDLNDRTLAEFGIALPESLVQGSGPAAFDLAFVKDGDNRLTLTSELNGIAMALAGTGWSKPAGTRGKLLVEARLGDRPVVDELTLTAAGLSASGRVTTAEGGGLGTAEFDRVRIGDWLDAPVVVTGRGPNNPVSIAVTGGTIDLRKADLGSGSGVGRGARGPREPLILALDRLIVTDAIQLRNLRADLDLAGGMSGTFVGRVVEGARVKGTVAQQDEGMAFRITSKDAGLVMRGAGVFSNARGGDLELVLAPVAGEGNYEGEFTITGTRVVDAPTLAELLSAVSVVGILEQLNGEGIGFETVEGRFRMSPGAITLYRSSAVGVSMGISLDGYYDMRGGKIDMQGVLSPLYFLNALGRIFAPRDGEGLIGFNFAIRGDYDNPSIDVNPLSILTPGAFREIFRRPPPEAPPE